MRPSGSNPTPANQGQNVGPDLVTQEFGARQGQVFLTGSFYIDRNNNHFYTPGEGLGSVTITAVGRSGQGVFQTQTWDAGGYSLSLPPGSYVVTAKGSLPSPQTTVVTIGRSNVWWEKGFSAGSQIQAQSNSTPIGDIPVPGDYYGNGTTALAVFRTSTAQWFIGGRSQPVQFGATGDVPVPGDYDGNGTTDLAVYRPSTGQWFIAGHAQPIQFGAAGTDIPVPGDYDGNGKTELAIYRPTTGQWFVGGRAQPIQFGAAKLDIPVPGDYNGDGHTDFAVYRPTTGQWFIGGQAQPIQIGMPGQDVPVRGDFDGDGRTDAAVFRPSTAQWIYAGTKAGANSVQFGAPGSLPSASTWLSGSTVLAPHSPVASFAVSGAQSNSGLGTGRSMETPISLLDLTPWGHRSKHMPALNSHNTITAARVTVRQHPPHHAPAGHRHHS